MDDIPRYIATLATIMTIILSPTAITRLFRLGGGRGARGRGRSCGAVGDTARAGGVGRHHGPHPGAARRHGPTAAAAAGGGGGGAAGAHARRPRRRARPRGARPAPARRAAAAPPGRRRRAPPAHQRLGRRDARRARRRPPALARRLRSRRRRRRARHPQARGGPAGPRRARRRQRGRRPRARRLARPLLAARRPAVRRVSNSHRPSRRRGLMPPRSALQTVRDRLRAAGPAPWAAWTPAPAAAPAVAVDDVVAVADVVATAKAVETVALGAPEEVVEADSDEAYEPLDVPAGRPAPWAALFGGAGSASGADGKAWPAHAYGVVRTTDRAANVASWARWPAAPAPVRAAEFVVELCAAVDRLGHHDAAGGANARWMLAPGAAELPDLLRRVASLPPPASQGCAAATARLFGVRAAADMVAALRERGSQAAPAAAGVAAPGHWQRDGDPAERAADRRRGAAERRGRRAGVGPGGRCVGDRGQRGARRGAAPAPSPAVRGTVRPL